MEGLTIRKKVMPPASQGSRSVSEALFSGLLTLLLIVLIPLLLLTLLLSFIWNKIFLEKQTEPTEPRPVLMHEVVNDRFPLRYHYMMGEEISEGAVDYFADEEPLIIYQPATDIGFFRAIFQALKLNT